jgi:antitoxin component YwqK of YwqJK toxin-antitoxin module
MKRSSLLLFFFAFAIIFSSCRNAREEYYSNGKLKSVIHIRGGKYYGKAVYYYPNGDVQLECFYKDDILQGPLIRYYTLGRKKEQQNYDKGNLDGLSTTWYPDGGKSSETTYMNGLLNGPYREYHPRDRIKVQGQYLEGFFSGRWFYFGMGGDVVGEAKFIHGTGIQRSYFPDGKISRVVHYKDNRKDGEEVEYDPAGKVVSVSLFRSDSLVGIRPQ